MLLGADIDRNNVLLHLKVDLREMIDPDFLLPEELVSQGVLSDEHRQNVKEKGSYQERNDVLLNFVIQNDVSSLTLSKFTTCLGLTDQDHVCNFIHCEGGKQTFYLVYVYFLIVCGSVSGAFLYIMSFNATLFAAGLPRVQSRYSPLFAVRYFRLCRLCELAT